MKLATNGHILWHMIHDQDVIEFEWVDDSETMLPTLLPQLGNIPMKNGGDINITLKISTIPKNQGNILYCSTTASVAIDLYRCHHNRWTISIASPAKLFALPPFRDNTFAPFRTNLPATFLSREFVSVHQINEHHSINTKSTWNLSSLNLRKEQRMIPWRGDGDGGNS